MTKGGRYLLQRMRAHPGSYIALSTQRRSKSNPYKKGATLLYLEPGKDPVEVSIDDYMQLEYGGLLISRDFNRQYLK